MKTKRSFFPVSYLIILISGIFCLSGRACAETSEARQIPELENFTDADRVLVLAPHPDDEAIACSGVIQKALESGAPVHILFLTNGDHNQFAFIVYEKRITFRKNEFIHMGQVRRRESVKAMGMLGLPESHLIFLGYPDFGTFTIFRDYWNSKKAYKSLLTKINKVPYKENPTYGSEYKAENILRDIKKALLKYRPTKIFVSHPADVNVDHKTFYLFLQVALSDLKGAIPEPKVYPYLVHCVGWPQPRHYHPELSLSPPKQFLDSPIGWVQYELAPEQLERKHKTILCYRSQTESSAFYLLSFARKNELFGSYPEIELHEQDDSPLETKPSMTKKVLAFFGLSRMYLEKTEDPNAQQDVPAEIQPDQISYALEEDALLIRLDKSEDLYRRVSTQIYLFGYSYAQDFADMPKLRILTKYNKAKVFSSRKLLPSPGVALEVGEKELLIKVPLKLMGDPDYILLSVKAYTGKSLVNSSGFQKIVIRRD